MDDFVSLSKDYVSLEQMLDLTKFQPLPSWGTDIRSKWDAIVDGEKTAAALRAWLNLGLAPLTDLGKTLEGVGVKVVFRALLDSKVWGFSVTSKALGNCIFVNAACTRERQNFTLAHELGHLTMDRDHSATILTGARSPESSEDIKTLLEVRANSFAASFLMPDLAIRQTLATLGVFEGKAEKLTTVMIDSLRQQFGVSYDAMLWRLVNLKMISVNVRSKYTFEPVEEKRTASSSPKDNLPERYRNLAFTAYQGAKISIGKLAELLRLDMYETRKLVKTFRIQQVPV